jgi:hypothetical protein
VRKQDASRFSRSAPKAAQRCERERFSKSISGASCVSCRRHRSGLEADLEEDLPLQLEPAQPPTYHAGLDRRQRAIETIEPKAELPRGSRLIESV